MPQGHNNIFLKHLMNTIEQNCTWGRIVKRTIAKNFSVSFNYFTYQSD